MRAFPHAGGGSSRLRLSDRSSCSAAVGSVRRPTDRTARSGGGETGSRRVRNRALATTPAASPARPGAHGAAAREDGLVRGARAAPARPAPGAHRTGRERLGPSPRLAVRIITAPRRAGHHRFSPCGSPPRLAVRAGARVSPCGRALVRSGGHRGPRAGAVACRVGGRTGRSWGVRVALRVLGRRSTGSYEGCRQPTRARNGTGISRRCRRGPCCPAPAGRPSGARAGDPAP